MTFPDASTSALAAHGAMYILADGLGGEGFEVIGPALDNSQYLKVINVRGTWCEIVIRQNGLMRWDYRPFGCEQPDPQRATGIILAVLGADSSPENFPPPGEPAGLSFASVVGRALDGRSVEVCMPRVPPSDLSDFYSEVRVSNPARPDRGTACVSDDALVRWECQFGAGPGKTGLRDITETIAQVLEPARLD